MPRISKEQLIQFNKKYAYLIDDIQDFAISYEGKAKVAGVQPYNVKWIYAALVTHCRKQGWVQPFLMSDVKLSRTTGISNRHGTFEKARQILKAWRKLDYLETPMGVFYTFDKDCHIPNDEASQKELIQRQIQIQQISDIGD